jgi:hypothetical protein
MMKNMCPNKQYKQCCQEEALAIHHTLKEEQAGMVLPSKARRTVYWENGAQWEFQTHGVVLPTCRSLFMILTLNGHDT